MLYVKKVAYTLKVLVSWALLPLLTLHRLSCRRHWSLATGSSGGRRIQVAVVLSYNHASTWTGSHLTRKCLLLFFPRLYEGILHDVFIQKAAVAWDNAPSSRIMVSLLLPGPMEADQWLHTVRANRHMWPLQMTSHAAANQLATDIFMRRERRRLQARHIWEKIQPNWPLIAERVWTKHATGLPYQALYRRLFLLEYTEESNVVEHGLRSKLLRSSRTNGSALCVFKDWIRWMCCLGNGLIATSA